VENQIKKENKVEMFELKNLWTGQKLVNLILQSLSLLSKDNEKHLPSLVFLRLGERSVRVKCVRVSKINFFRKRFADGSKKRQKTETEALNNRYGLILIVPLTGVPHHHKDSD
jgi:hypothetical protein